MWEYEYKINTAIEVRLVSEAEQIKLRFKSQVKFWISRQSGLKLRGQVSALDCFPEFQESSDGQKACSVLSQLRTRAMDRDQQGVS